MSSSNVTLPQTFSFLVACVLSPIHLHVCYGQACSHVVCTGSFSEMNSEASVALVPECCDGSLCVAHFQHAASL